MKKGLRILGFSLAALVLATILLFLCLPFIAEKVVVPALAPKLPFNQQQITISTITPWTTRATLRLGNTQETTLSIARLEAHYSPLQLLRGTIDSLHLEGATLHLRLQNNKLHLHGLAPQTKKATKSTRARRPLVLPVALQTLVLRDCYVKLHHNKRSHKASIDGELQLEYASSTSGGNALLQGSGQIDIGDDLQLSTTLALATRGEENIVTATTTVTELDTLMALLPRTKEADITGSLQATTTLIFNKYFTLKRFSAETTLDNFTLATPGLKLGQNGNSPPTLTFNGDLRKARYSLNNIGLLAPWPLTSSLHGNLQRDNKTLSGNGSLALVLHAGTAAGLTLHQDTPLRGDYSFATDQSQQLTATANLLSKPDQPLSIGAGATELTLKPFAIQLAAASGAGRQDITATLATPGGELTHAKTTVTVQQPEVQVELTRSPHTTNATLTTTLPSISLPTQSLRIVDIRADVPLSWPPPSNPAPATTTDGVVTIGVIHHKGQNLGAMEMQLSQHTEELHIAGNATTPVLPAGQLNFYGGIGYDKTMHLKYRIDKTPFDSISLSALPLPKGLSAQGSLTLQGDLSYTRKGLKGALAATVIDTSVELAEKKISAQGINLQLTLPQLPSFSSAPSQKLTIDRLDMGELRFTNGLIHYRLEDLTTLFLEQSRFHWCKGQVTMGSLRLSPLQPQIETTLYCDRLHFAELLEQLGIKETEGDGTLNGKLPLFLSASEIRFDDGFLFSTPGQSGIIRFNNTKMLRNSIPSLDQTGHLDYSLQSLENFAYNWTKLTFQNEGDSLRLSMQIDGKPAAPLPYGYINGQIQKTQEGPGLQHPVRLDVNFHLPLADMFHYGQNIQSLMENM